MKKLKQTDSYRLVAVYLRQGEDVVRTVNTGSSQAFEEHLQHVPTLVIFGGGHVSLPLCNLAKMLSYEVIVIDDRVEFANKTRFSMADQVYCLKFADVFEQISFPHFASYVIVTRGHEHDFECLKHVLDGSFGYAGMIGSRKKVAATFARLEKEGYEQSLIDLVHAPIGLMIGGQTPEEIAVSIAAELIQERARTLQTTMEPKIMEWLLEKEEPMMMLTIIAKKGSAPRGTGARLLICGHGEAVGTVGGGAVEYQAKSDALDLLRRQVPFDVRHYDLSNSDAGKLGMICGGQIEIAFELVKEKGEVGYAGIN